MKEIQGKKIKIRQEERGKLKHSNEKETVILIYLK